MMRGAPGDTQIHGAKALCNLTCDEDCASLLLKTGHVSDFVVIAILRTNSPLIKEICSQSLFNLLHHEKYRNEMVETGVLWALMKLSKLESKQTQNICAKVLFNFSCYDSMQERIMEHGVGRLLGIAQSKNSDGVDVEDSQTKQFCAGALCNLAFRPEAGALYAKGGAIDFMKDLMEEDDEDNEMYCATILYNLSHCDISSRVSLVQENAVPLIVNLSRSGKHRTIVASLGSSYNLSLCMEARKEMVSENLVPAIMSCVGHTSDMDLVCLGMASLYHLTCDARGHDAESCVHLVGTGCAGSVVDVLSKHGGNRTVSTLCSRVLLNMAMDGPSRPRMVEAGILEAVSNFQGIGGEELANGTKIFSLLANCEEALEEIVGHGTFDFYCEHMLAEGKSEGGSAGRGKLLLLSQVFLNVALSPSCRLPLISKPYFESCLSSCSLKSDALNLNVVGTIKLLVEDVASKETVMRTSAAGILSRISQSTSSPDCKHLCGKILNGMSGRRSTVTYSEGSIVAVLSTFVEEDPDEVPYRVRAEVVEVKEVVPVEVRENITVPKIDYNKLEPSWDTHSQVGNKEVKPLKKTPPMQAVVLHPPKVFTLQTNGTFEKIRVEGLGKLLLDNIDLVSDDEDGGTVGGGGGRKKGNVEGPSVPPPEVKVGEEEEEEKKDDGFQFTSLKLDMGGLGGFVEGDED